MTKAQAISRMNHADLTKKVDNYSKEEVKNYLHTIIMMNNVPGNKFLQKTSYEKNNEKLNKQIQYCYHQEGDWEKYHNGGRKQTKSKRKCTILIQYKQYLNAKEWNYHLAGMCWLYQVEFFDVELGVRSMLLMKCPWELHEVAPKMGAKIFIVTWKPWRGRGFVSFKEGCRIGEHDYLVDDEWSLIA